MAASTALGRVQPIFKGNYNSDTTYYRLDNVYYQGNTYVCKVDSVTNIAPAEGSSCWQLVAHKGEQGDQGITGSFGEPSGTVTILPTGSEPNITITATGPDTAKEFKFDFDLPAGPTGFDVNDIRATATNNAGATTASAVINEGKLGFTFNIPPAQGEGAAMVDGVGPSGSNRNVELKAVRYGINQQISEAEKQIARNNIGAQEAGNYQPAGDYIEDPRASTGQFLRFSNEGEWVGENINLVPTGAASDVGKYLRKTSNSMIWADVQSLPSGGSEGAPLIKNSVDDYDVTWGTFISNSEIDEIINA